MATEQLYTGSRALEPTQGSLSIEEIIRILHDTARKARLKGVPEDKLIVLEILAQEFERCLA
jgi:hypothetical protein